MVFCNVDEATCRPAENPVAGVLREGGVVGLANHTALITRDGTDRPIDDSAAPIRGGDGTTRGVVLVFRDVTERRRAEEARRQLAAIIESMDDVILDKMLDSIITGWNKDAEHLYGYAAEEIVGRPIALLIPPDRAGELPTIVLLQLGGQ